MTAPWNEHDPDGPGCAQAMLILCAVVAVLIVLAARLL